MSRKRGRRSSNVAEISSVHESGPALQPLEAVRRAHRHRPCGRSRSVTSCPSSLRKHRACEACRNSHQGWRFSRHPIIPGLHESGSATQALAHARQRQVSRKLSAFSSNLTGWRTRQISRGEPHTRRRRWAAPTRMLGCGPDCNHRITDRRRTGRRLPVRPYRVYGSGR